MSDTLPNTDLARSLLPADPQIETFNFPADYFFIAVEDRDYSPPRVWQSKATTASGRPVTTWTAMRTGRDAEVQVTVEIRREPPANDLDEWESVEEESLALPSGVLQLRNGVDRQFAATPGVYRLRFYARSLETVKHEGQEADEYRIVLWPDEAGDSTVLKDGFPG